MSKSGEQATMIRHHDIGSWEACHRIYIKEGIRVLIGTNKDDDGPLWINGFVKYIITPPEEEYSEDGVKVRITDGTIGYVKKILRTIDEEKLKKMIQEGESRFLEFKETFKVDASTKTELKCLRDEVVKEIAAFMNTRGGMLLIGVTDLQCVTGLTLDYRFINPKRYNQSKQDKLKQEIRSYVGEKLQDNTLETRYDITFKCIDRNEICVIEVNRSKIPVFVDQKIMYCKCNINKHFLGKRQIFYIRTDSGAKMLDAREFLKFWEDRSSDVGGFE